MIFTSKNKYKIVCGDMFLLLIISLKKLNNIIDYLNAVDQILAGN